MERGFGVLKIKYLCLKHPILMHNNDNIYYVFLSCVVMHNMMVHCRIDAGEEESTSFYEVLDEDTAKIKLAMVGEEEGNGSANDKHGSDGYVSFKPVQWAEKMAIVHKRWSKLYDKEESKRLQTAIMNQIYKDNFGD